MLGVQAVEYFLDKSPSWGTHWFFELIQEAKPIDFPVLIVRFFEQLDVIFLHENSICIKALNINKQDTFSKLNPEISPVT